MKTTVKGFRKVVLCGIMGMLFSTASFMFANDSLVPLCSIVKQDKQYCHLFSIPYSGSAVEYYNNGQLSLKKSFKDGKLDGKTTEWYPNGQKKLEVNFKDGVLVGNYSSWYYNGNKYLSLNYVNGGLEGLNTAWYDSGVKMMECNFTKGNLNGVLKKWDNNGNTLSTIVYKNGIKLDNNLA